MSRLYVSAICMLVGSLFWGCAERNDAIGPGANVLRFVSQTPTQGAAKDVTVVEGIAYVADEPFGISLYDVSTPGQPQLVSTFTLQANTTKARAVAVDPTGRVACVDSDNGLQFFDLQNGHYLNARGSGPHVEVQLSYENDELKIFRCDRNDGFTYEMFQNTGTADSLWFDYLQSPDFYSIYQELYEMYGFCLNNNQAYVARNDVGVALVDYTATPSAAMIDELNTAGKVRDAAISSDGIVCLAADYEGLITLWYDITDQPNQLALLGSLRIENADDIEWVEVISKRAFLLDDNDGVFVADVSDPTNPTLIGEMETSDPNNFCVANGYVYVADEDMGLVIGEIID